jgi:hypothetical protein
MTTRFAFGSEAKAIRFHITSNARLYITFYLDAPFKVESCEMGMRPAGRAATGLRCHAGFSASPTTKECSCFGPHEGPPYRD